MSSFADMPHPQAADIMQQMEQFQSTIDACTHRSDKEFFTGMDEDKTVQVTLDSRLALKDLFIEDGVLRLGAQAVNERINDALTNAQAAAHEGISAQHEELLGGLVEVVETLQKVFNEK